jgi:hemoglobin
MDTEKSVYEQLGGKEGIEKAVEKFYELVLADPIVNEFFAETNMEFLKKHQRNFFTVALGGPNVYAGRDMRKSHENMKLEDIHFDQIKKHLGESLAFCGANDEQIKTVLDKVETLRNDVLNR